ILLPFLYLYFLIHPFPSFSFSTYYLPHFSLRLCFPRLSQHPLSFLLFLFFAHFFIPSFPFSLPIPFSSLPSPSSQFFSHLFFPFSAFFVPPSSPNPLPIPPLFLAHF